MVWTCDVRCDVSFAPYLVKSIFDFWIPWSFYWAAGFCQKFHICGSLEYYFFLIPFWGLPNQQLITVLEECYLSPKGRIGQISVIHTKCPIFTVGKRDVNLPWHQIAQRNVGNQFQKLCCWSFCYVFPFPFVLHKQNTKYSCLVNTICICFFLKCLKMHL